MPEPRSARPPT